MNTLIRFKNEHTRSGSVGRAWTNAILYSPDDKLVFNEDDAELVILYGCGPSNVEVYERSRARGIPTVSIDIGYWKRGGPSDPNAHYKVSVNWHHPQNYLMKLDMDGKRFAGFNRGNDEPQHWRAAARQILLAGMGPKSFQLYKMNTQEWDIWAYREIRKHTDMPVVYRPKPSWTDPKGISGTVFSNSSQNLDTLLTNTSLVVTHHSNVAIDGLLMGVPAMCVDGAANSVCGLDFSSVEAPPHPSRTQFFWNLAWCNWSVSEIENGECLRFLKEHVLPIA